jgi:hypothetical protein
VLDSVPLGLDRLNGCVGLDFWLIEDDLQKEQGGPCNGYPIRLPASSIK